MVWSALLSRLVDDVVQSGSVVLQDVRTASQQRGQVSQGNVVVVVVVVVVVAWEPGSR